MMDTESGETKYILRDDERESLFDTVWNSALHDVFVDVADYYDGATNLASLGLDEWLKNRFLTIIELSAEDKVLDLCAGTNAIGLKMVQKQADISLTAIDSSQAMLSVGKENFVSRGLSIDSVLGDVHHLPFPDESFDVVTMRYASRHLRIYDVCREALRVLKPGGYFYHNDIFKPKNDVIKYLYFLYLRASLAVTAMAYHSGEVSLGCRDYFIDALEMFYTVEEFTDLLVASGFEKVESSDVLLKTVGFHSAKKPC